MKHTLSIVLIIAVTVTGMLLPYMHGDHDYFAVGISSIIQFAAFASLLFVPIGVIWCLMDFFSRGRKNTTITHAIRLRNITWVVTAIVILAAALGGFASHNRFSALIILGSGIFILVNLRRKAIDLRAKNSAHLNGTPFFLIFIPLVIFLVRISFLEKVKDKSTEFVIEQSELLIEDIEAYKIKNGHYPVSLLSTIEDYKTNVSGIERFHYERNGNAYNLYFEQFSDVVGTQEIVMYNKLNEHEMTVHNQDLLRITPGRIFRGYHKSAELRQEHWKIFYFD